MRIRILDLARDDLIQGFRFYEDKERGLGRHFLTNLYQDIEGLPITAGPHGKPYNKYHRALSKKFPFAIFDTVEDTDVAIRAVVDCRRSPSWIREHLKLAQQNAARRPVPRFEFDPSRDSS